MSGTAETSAERHGRMLRSVTAITAGWTAFYGLYRLYYAVGGTVGMPGVPASEQQWLYINAVAAALLFTVAALPVLLHRTWQTSFGRTCMLALAWLIAVACVSHAAIGIVQRISSLAGALTIPYPFWQSIDRREADLQALFFNEPWFLGEGVLWGVLAWTGALYASPRRRLWIASAIAAVTVATAIGLLSAFGVLGRVIVG